MNNQTETFENKQQVFLCKVWLNFAILFGEKMLFLDK
jgi:hypothetical protein